MLYSTEVNAEFQTFCALVGDLLLSNGILYGHVLVPMVLPLNLAVFQVEGLLVQMAADKSQEVIDEVFERLLVAVLRWIEASDLLYTSLVPCVLSSIKAVLQG